MDFITHLPMTTQGHDAIFTVVDKLSKLTHFIPTTTAVDAVGVAQLFFDHIFRHHGQLKRVLDFNTLTITDSVTP